MAHVIELHKGDLLVLRRADGSEPSGEEQERLAMLASDLELVGVLILGVDDCFDGARRVGTVRGSGGPSIDVAVEIDRDKMPEHGQVVYVGAKEA